MLIEVENTATFENLRGFGPLATG